MKRVVAFAVCVLVSATTLIAAEDWRGNNRLAGTVVDKSNGQAVAGATLKLRIQKGAMGGPDVKSDKSGRWAVLGLSSGSWNIDVEAPGYELRQIGPVAMSEGQRLPPIKIELDPQVAAAPAATEGAPVQEEVKIGGVSVTPEVAAAIEAGNKFMTEQKFKQAVTEYEKAYPVLSSNIGLKFALARAYYGAGDVKKAVVLLDEAYKADPTNNQTALVLANMLVEDGQTERASEIIEKLPAGAVTDSTVYINMGITAMNKKKPGIAYDYFSKAMTMNAEEIDPYYYRGLASIQMGKAKQAKPDLEKVVSMGQTRMGDAYLETACKDEADKTACRARITDSVKSMVAEAKEYLKSIK